MLLLDLFASLSVNFAVAEKHGRCGVLPVPAVECSLPPIDAVFDSNAACLSIPHTHD